MGLVFAALAVPLLYFGVGRHAEPSFFTLGVMAAALGGVFLWNARAYRRFGGAADEVNSTFAQLIAGQDAEAERRLEAMAARTDLPSHVLRPINVQRTLLAMRRGQMDAAIGFATRTIEGDGRPAKNPWESLQVVEARALRALALASVGRSEEALADARTAESSPMLGALALGRLSLARAVVLAKAGRLEELHAHYAAEGDALGEELLPRERALSRALRRMGQPRTRSIYREAAILDDPADDPARDWVRKIAPDAARFVPTAARGPLADEAGASPISVEPLSPISPLLPPTSTRPAKGALSKKAAVLWVVLLVGFAVVRVRSSGGHGRRPDPVAGAGSPWTTLAIEIVVGVAAMAVLFAVGWTNRRRQQRKLQALHQAQLALVRGDDPVATATLEELASTGGITLAPIACLAQAQAALRRGDEGEALRATAQGISLSTATLQARAFLQDLHLPDLLGTHAFALAVAGRAAEAKAALAALDRDHPSFPFRARAFYRVELINAIKRGDLAAASRLVAAREPEMSVELRIDLLGDVACAAAVGGLSDEAAEALQSELHSMPRVAQWIEHVAPGLGARIGRDHSIRVATPYASYDDDTRPLDAEAAQLLALGARRPRS